MTSSLRPDHAPPLVTLDILRAAAAMLVVLEHSRGLAFLTFTRLPTEQQTLLVKIAYLGARLGQEAVMLFFVLSGYLVGGQVIRRVRQGNFDPRDFAIDRATRILLPLVPAALFAGLVGTLIKGVPFHVVQVAGNAAGLNGILIPTLPFDLPLWSLPYEIWFYVIAGAGAAICAGRGGVVALGAALAAMVVFCRLDASLILIWMLGALVSAVDLRRWRGALAAIGLVVLVSGSAAIQSARPSLAGIHDGALTVDLARSIFAAGVAMTMPWLASAGINRALANQKALARAASFLAGMSYTLYLFHYPALNILDRWFVPGPVSVVAFARSIASLSMLLAFAAAMYWLFERNTDHVRRRLKAWRARRADDGDPVMQHSPSRAMVSPKTSSYYGNGTNA
jgi:peptidoglycan/LPS O-acetylase OafA/YrhL